MGRLGDDSPPEANSFQFLLELCDRAIVMNFGRKIAEGTPDQIPGCRFVEQKQTRSRGESARSPDQSLLAKDRLPIALSARCFIPTRAGASSA
jgi:ABC-type multidrug transport system ATPase subunit